MKRKLIITCAALTILSNTNAFGQAAFMTSTANNSHIVTNPSTTRVGILDNDPWDPLTVNGKIGYTENNTGYNELVGRSPGNGMAIYGNYSFAGGSGLVMNSWNNGGSLRFVASPATNSSFTEDFNFLHTDGTNYWSRLFIHKNGNVGIGETNPQDKLTVDGGIGFTQTYTQASSVNRSIRGWTSHNNLELFANSNTSDGSAILLRSYNAGGYIDFIGQHNASSTLAFNFSTWDNTSPGQSFTQMQIFKDGQVVIGNVPTVSSSDYKLYVETGILTERVKVALSNDPTNWSDFVFADDYKLRSLDEVEDYIKENKHLPEIPSTEEVHKEGLDLAQMDAKLLQKIEELTLYVIEQNKKIEAQEKRIEQLLK